MASGIVSNDGSFFCHACLVGKPTVKASPDPRYCQGCYDFLLNESEILTGHTKKTEWWPKPAAELIPRVSLDGGENMATVKGQESTVAIFQSLTPKVTHTRRGPKQKALPLELIVQWQGEGMGSKVIAAKLNTQYGIKISFRTIARILSGQRVLL